MRRFKDPEAPEVLEAILERIRSMTREELIEALYWKPENAEETWRMYKPQEEEEARREQKGNVPRR